MPRFTSHEELKGHLVNMSDTELNRMRDFGCGKPHWSPYYVDPAYTHESRAIEGDKVSNNGGSEESNEASGSEGKQCRNVLHEFACIFLFWLAANPFVVASLPLSLPFRCRFPFPRSP